MRFFLCLLPFALSPALFAGEDPLHALKEEVRRTAEQRDRARQQLLQMEADALPRIHSLTAERDALAREIEQSNQRLLEARTRATATETALRRAEEELKLRDARVDDLRRQLREGQAAFAEILNRIRRSAEASETARQELERERDLLLRDLQHRAAQLEAEEMLRTEVSRERDQFRLMSERLGKELLAAKRAEALANAKVAALESRLNHLRQALETQVAERTALERERDDLRGRIRELTERLESAGLDSTPSAEMERLRRDLAEALAQNERLRAELASRRDLPDLRRDLEQARRDRDRLDARAKELAEKLQQAERQIREEFGPVREAMATLEEENRRLRQEMEEQKSAVDHLNEQLDLEQTRNRAQVLELQALLTQHIRDLARAQVEIESLTERVKQIPALEAERAELIARRDKSMNDLRVLANHIHALRQQISEGRAAKAALAQTQVEAEALRRDLEASRQQAETLRRTKESLESELEVLRRRLYRETSTP